MRVLVVMLASTGCQLVFPLEGKGGDPADGGVDGGVDAATPNRPFGCSPASLLTDGFTDNAALGRPWALSNLATVQNAFEHQTGVQFAVTIGTLDAIAEPYLELREHEYTVNLQHVGGMPAAGDRATLDLVTEDGLHRLSYGLVALAGGGFELVADYLTFDGQGGASPTLIGKHAAGNAVELVIRHAGDVTTFLTGPAPETELFTTRNAPLDWIGYMRPILHFTAASGMNIFDAQLFNRGIPPSGVACPASTIHETFEPDLSTEWQRQTPGNQCSIVSDAGGNLRMVHSAATAEHTCIIHTSTLYDLREHQLELVVAEVVPAQATFVRVELEIESRTSRARLRLDVPTSKLLATIDDSTAIDGEAPVGQLPIDLGQLLPALSVWRITATAADELIFEVGDGTTFRTVGATQAGVVGALDQVRVRVLARASGVGDGALVRFAEIRSR